MRASDSQWVEIPAYNFRCAKTFAKIVQLFSLIVFLSFRITFYSGLGSLACLLCWQTTILACSFFSFSRFYLFARLVCVNTKKTMNCKVWNVLFTLNHTFESRFRLTFLLICRKQYNLDWQLVAINMLCRTFLCKAPRKEVQLKWHEQNKQSLQV